VWVRVVMVVNGAGALSAWGATAVGLAARISRGKVWGSCGAHRVLVDGWVGFHESSWVRSWCIVALGCPQRIEHTICCLLLHAPSPARPPHMRSANIQPC
jgi:hypothetical protein